MSKCKHFFLLIGFLGPLVATGSFGQGTELKKADQLYRMKAYARAVPLYEEVLRSRFRVSTAQKLASCYRLTNAWTQAESLLDSLVQQDKVREDMWFLYGEALMSNGKYDQAREWFLKYAAAQPADTLALIRADACLIVGAIPPYFQNVRYERLPFNSDEDDHAAIPWGTGLLFTSDRSPGLHLLKEKSQWTGRDYLALFETYPLTDSTWTEPKRYSGRINEININVGYAILSADSSTLYFTRNTVEPNKRGVYPLQIYTCQREGSDGWTRPRPVSFANPETNMMHPAMRADGRMMVYASDRSGGLGGLDLWMVEWSGSDWGRPQRLDPTINTAGHEGFPWFAADDRLFFASKGHPGYGGYDLFVTEQDSTGAWSSPLNLGRPLNSPLDDITFYLEPSGTSGYFSSTREGEDDDLYYWYQEAVPGKEDE